MRIGRKLFFRLWWGREKVKVMKFVLNTPKGRRKKKEKISFKKLIIETFLSVNSPRSPYNRDYTNKLTYNIYWTTTITYKNKETTTTITTNHNNNNNNKKQSKQTTIREMYPI